LVHLVCADIAYIVGTLSSYRRRKEGDIPIAISKTIEPLFAEGIFYAQIIIDFNGQ